MENMIKRGKRLLVEMACVIMAVLIIDVVIYYLLSGIIVWRLIPRIIYTGLLFYLTIGKSNWARIILGIISVLSTIGVFFAFIGSFYIITKVISLILALFYGLVAYNLFFSDDIKTYMNSEE
ncbi:hypothetical protein [Oceanirhabdus sp. W0125-5]|uniref:hypothetical protein n=1 Tax=Oceanirhabdus sp. W0125-5 TaxID=2999116 RepID=UPI0022F2B787|nr:hypothetical protein [Oceanirhabdus sp. W0125-5]WBW99192.1 hypothetical protein OW730_10720 [Oceanirhabdus sp. W0125-5]